MPTFLGARIGKKLGAKLRANYPEAANDPAEKIGKDFRGEFPDCQEEESGGPTQKDGGPTGGKAKFHGGSKPDQVDISYFAHTIVGRFLEHHSLKDHLEACDLENWCAEMQKIMPNVLRDGGKRAAVVPVG